VKKKEVAICAIHSVSTRTKPLLKSLSGGLISSTICYELLCWMHHSKLSGWNNILEDVIKKFHKARSKENTLWPVTCHTAWTAASTSSP